MQKIEIYNDSLHEGLWFKNLSPNLLKNAKLVSINKRGQNPKRDQQMLCVIEDVSDLWTLERIGFYRGVYHVLGGTLSAINGVGINELNISNILRRIKKNNIKEVVLALSTTMEGQTTSHVIADKLEHFQIEVTRLAQGIPIGGEVHYLDGNTLSTAFQARKKII